MRSFRLNPVPEAQENLVSAAQLLLPKLLHLKDSQSTPVVLIDGRAGSGKSTFAELLKNFVFQEEKQSPRVIHMDDIYQGWDGLEEGSLYLSEQILKPLRSKGNAEWQRWDWERGVRGGKDEGNGWKSFEGQNLLIVEGCGSVTETTNQLADLCIWVESSHETRKLRFHERDRGKFSEHWIPWSIQEDAFYQKHNSKGLCHLVVEN